MSRPAGFDLRPSEEFLDTLAQRVADRIVGRLEPQPETWLDVAGASRHLGYDTDGAVRTLVNRRAIPHHKAPNGRILFARAELDDWVRSGGAT